MLWIGFTKKDLMTGGNVTKREQLELTDILCRMISTDGKVELNERIWMNKMCKGNDKARELAGAMLCPDTMGEDVCYK